MTRKAKLQMIRKLAYAREGGRCFWCRQMTRRRGPRSGMQAPNLATLDHIIPRSAGGELSMGNVVLSCYACNNARGNLSAEAFLQQPRGPESSPPAHGGGNG